MKVSLSTLKLFVVLIVFINVECVTSIKYVYTDDGVYRDNGECNLTFVNFGTETNLNDGGKINLSNKNNRNIKPFDVTIKNLFNGNIGLNNNTVTDQNDLANYIQITQKIGDTVKTINTFSIVNYYEDSGKFNLKISGIDTCEGIIIKQLFKEDTVVVANRLYYVNAVPENMDINRAYDSNKFGPSLKYPFNRLHWKINEGLDDLRKTCGIYMYYKKFTKYYAKDDISAHWEYYLSPSKNKTINSKNCTTEEFFEVIRRNYIDYHYTKELLGKDYMAYVLKREGHIELHMDGIIANNGYLIEMYQNSCNPEFNQQTFCTLKSDDALTFYEFVNKFSEECLNINLDEEQPQWVIKSEKATGTFKNQIVTIQRPSQDRKGELPTTTEGYIKYQGFNSDSLDYENSTPIARFAVSFECKDGTFMSNKCRCESCPFNCLTCTSMDNCTTCVDEEGIELKDGMCKDKPGYFTDKDGKNKKCEDECKTCDVNGCLTCHEDSLKVIMNGKCVCPSGYYETDDQKCEQCKSECGECNRADSCTVCKDKEHAFISDGVCVCKNSYLEEDGNCHICDEGCLACEKDKCLACVDKTKEPVNGKC